MKNKSSSYKVGYKIALGVLCLSIGAYMVNFAKPVFAQTQPETEQLEEAEKVPEAQDNGLLPPLYAERMERLAEVLGALHYLRKLCGADEDQLWRNEMQKLITKENPSKERKEKMIARFNRGFRGYQEIYRECTPAAIEAGNRYRREGIRISAEIPSRYGN